MNRAKAIAMIPARIGSTRLPMKNLALIDGQPLISYAIQAARDSGVFERIILNADAPVFGQIADRYGVEFYQRPAELGSSSTKSDDVVRDFMEKHPAEVLAWVNPTSPLQTGNEVREVVNYFHAEHLDTLITVNNAQVHANFNGSPLNYVTNELFAQTQDLTLVELFVYSIMMWRTSPFLEDYKRQGHAFFVGKCGFYPVSKETAIIIKRSEDLRLAEQIMKVRKAGEVELKYDPLTQEARQ
jgi:CMP-N-acetylneuraminic acid synthetase